MTDYTDLIALLRENADLDAAEHVPSGVVQMQYDAADAIEALVKERDSFYMDYRMKCDVEAKRLDVELTALRKQIDALEPVAWHFSGKPLYLLDGIKK